jgi:hypothetical protein
MRKKYLIVLVPLALLGAFVVFYHFFGNADVRTPPCVANLELLRIEKGNWMRMDDKTTNDIPTWEEIDQIISPSTLLQWSNGRPVCPDGGVYTLHRGGDLPTCSIGGPRHALPVANQ